MEIQIFKKMSRKFIRNVYLKRYTRRNEFVLLFFKKNTTAVILSVFDIVCVFLSSYEEKQFSCSANILTSRLKLFSTIKASVNTFREVDTIFIKQVSCACLALPSIPQLIRRKKQIINLL